MIYVGPGEGRTASAPKVAWTRGTETDVGGTSGGRPGLEKTWLSFGCGTGGLL